ncbi:MAG: Rrf2 family transcriptional regulator [Commensalibacter sp.]|nr:Rrf2 family transcriptional regulator [Commensalibacter sp.]
MLKISKLADYAMIVLIKLDYHQKTVASSILAQETGIPEPTVAKILKLLTRGKIVQSRRGPKSGYFLTLPLETISIAQVITVIDGPLNIVDCHENHCRADMLKCPLIEKWGFISKKVQDLLGGISLVDLKNHKMENQLVSETEGDRIDSNSTSEQSMETCFMQEAE